MGGVGGVNGVTAVGVSGMGGVTVRVWGQIALWGRGGGAVGQTVYVPGGVAVVSVVTNVPVAVIAWVPRGWVGFYPSEAYTATLQNKTRSNMRLCM